MTRRDEKDPLHPSEPSGPLDPNDGEVVPTPVGKKVDRELAFHIDMHIRDLVARGVAPDVARARALAAFGDVKHVAAELNRIGRATEGSRRRTRFMAEALHDARFALRMITRKKGVAALTIGVLALGIGATTAMFSVADGVLLRPLPFAQPDRVAAVWIAQQSLLKDPVLRSYAESTPLGNEEYQALRAGVTAFGELAIWSSGGEQLVTEAGIEQVRSSYITSTLLPLLRVKAALGRAFAAGDDVLDGPKVAMLSWEAWQSRYGSDTSVIGRSVTFTDAVYTVVGIMPPGFRLDRTNEPPAYWLPALQDSSDLPERHNRSYRAIGRLAAGASVLDAQRQSAIAFREVTHDTTLSARVEVWQRDQGRSASSGLVILLAAVGLLLLIACVNVAVLQLGEVSNRQREISARVALGAGTGRLVRQLLAESLMLSVVASVLGTALAWMMLKALLLIAPVKLPGMDTAHIDLRVLFFALGCSVLTGLLFGIAPALVAARGGTASLARTGAGQSSRGVRVLQRTLIATQLSLSMVLLVVATLFARSLRNVSLVDPGFRAESLTAFRVILPWRYPKERIRAMAADVAARISAMPGVESMTYGSSAPFMGANSSSPIMLDPSVAGDRKPQHTIQNYVAPGYFEALGIRLVAGRTFTPADGVGAEFVAIVSQSQVERDFAGVNPVNPLGQRVKQQNVWRTIVGVVADVRTKALAGEDGASIYVPYDQQPNSGPIYIVRGPAGAVRADAIRAMLRDVDPLSYLQRSGSVPSLMEQSYGVERYRTILVTAFGLFAAILAAVGLYGVSTRAAARRMREVGIRLALGGTSRGVTQLLVGDAMAGVALGIVIGLPVAVLVGRALKQYLFGVSATDPVWLVIVAALLAGVTALASMVPARRAARTSPSVVLRSD